MCVTKGVVRNGKKRTQEMEHPKGIILCEHQAQSRCRQPGVDYERTKGEAKGWDKLTDKLKEMLPYRNVEFMPITLCNKHSKNRKPLIKIK